VTTQVDRSELLSLAERLVTFGKIQGADEIEVSVADGTEFNVDVRMGKIESLLEASSRGLSIKVIKDSRAASSSSSDLSKDILHKMVKSAIKRAALSGEDGFVGLPPDTGTAGPSELRLFDSEVPLLDSQSKIHLALETERIALSDPQINNSHGASFETRDINTILAKSNGFSGEYRESFCSLSVGLQAGETDNRVEGFWFSSKRYLSELESPESVARRAIERTLRQLNPQKIKTQTVPVIFEPLMTSWLLGFLFSCISGNAIYQKSSFLLDKLGEKIGGDNMTIIDDPYIPGNFGTRPFDSEGVSFPKKTVVDQGVLKYYLCDTYAARKLNLQSTGNSSGGGIDPNNFFLQPGTVPAPDIISGLDRGMILTRTIGHGLNPVSGDVSRGAFGLWVENGEIAYPVSEVTISGNLGNILHSLESIGSDLEFYGAVAGPTIKISELTIAGN